MCFRSTQIITNKHQTMLSKVLSLFTTKPSNTSSTITATTTHTRKPRESKLRRASSKTEYSEIQRIRHESFAAYATNSMQIPHFNGSRHNTSSFSTSTDTYGAGVICTNDYSKLATTVRQIMSHPALGARFREYASSKHADEGICFLDDLATATMDANYHHTMEEHAIKLMNTYFLEGAPRWVNLPASLRETLLEKFESRSFTSLSALFDDAMYEVFTDLKKSDTFRDFCTHDCDAKALSGDTDTLLLDAWVVPERFHLISPLFTKDKDTLSRIRFCCSVVEFERLPAKSVQRHAQGNKIAATFVQSGARFQLQSIPKLYEDAILQGQHEQCMMDLRMECLQILSMEYDLVTLARRSVANGDYM